MYTMGAEVFLLEWELPSMIINLFCTNVPQIGKIGQEAYLKPLLGKGNLGATGGT